MKDFDFEDQSIDALERHNELLMAQRAVLVAEQRELAVILDRKRAEREALRQVKAMDDGQKAALVQALSVDGITSSETFGEM